LVAKLNDSERSSRYARNRIMFSGLSLFGMPPQLREFLREGCHGIVA
jgi:hypothetical protein